MSKKEMCLVRFGAKGGFPAECVLEKGHKGDCVGRNIEDRISKGEDFELDFTFIFNQVNGYRRHLEGKLLTIIEASISDHEQRKAFKDLVKQSIWMEDGWLKSLFNVAEGKPPYENNFIDINDLEENK